MGESCPDSSNVSTIVSCRYDPELVCNVLAFLGNVDCAAENLLCERMGVRGVPTLIFFNDGKMYKYKGAREYNDIMKFGAGDFRDSTDVLALPPPITGGVVHAAKYTMYKLIKDVHAVIRFNVWVVAFIFFVGFAMGSMVAMIFSMATFKEVPIETNISEQPVSQQGEAEKSSEDKKLD